MWNEDLKNHILDKYNFILHPLRNKKMILDGKEYRILNIFKRWSSGWYMSMEIKHSNENYVEIPYENINSEDPEILEKIENVRKRTKIEGV
jgi:hypothetical protein